MAYHDFSKVPPAQQVKPFSDTFVQPLPAATPAPPPAPALAPVTVAPTPEPVAAVSTAPIVIAPITSAPPILTTPKPNPPRAPRAAVPPAPARSATAGIKAAAELNLPPVSRLQRESLPSLRSTPAAKPLPPVQTRSTPTAAAASFVSNYARPAAATAASKQSRGIQ